MDSKEIDLWVARIREAGSREFRATEEYMDPFEPAMFNFQSVVANRFVRIEGEGFAPFYCYFQPCFDKEAPLIVHTPGYYGEMCMHPELAQYFHVLHINPLGYTTPKGKDHARLPEDMVPGVFAETMNSGAEKGYFEWLADCVMAVRWALKQPKVYPDRVSFFGTSQGGGASLLLSSIFNDITRAVASNEPFLTNFELAAGRGAYDIGREQYKDADMEKVERAKYLLDTTHHVHRISCPVLLASGGKDDTCPPETAADLFSRFSGTKSYTHFEHLGHGYNREFLQLVKAWFLIYA